MIEIYKTIQIPVKCSKEDKNHLYQCNKLSAEVWNLCIKLNDEFRLNNEGRWLDRNDLQKLTKKCVPLHAKGIHHAVHKYIFARDSMLKSKKIGTQNVKFPYKIKKYFTTGWDVQSIKVNYDKGIIFLPKPKYEIDGKVKVPKPIKLYAKTIPKNIVEIELIYKDKLYIAIKYKEPEEVIYKQIISDNKASIDLGEIHSITSIDNNGNSIIITGRKLREIKQLRNKELGKLSRKLAKTKKNSKQYKKYRKSMLKLKTKFDNKILDSVHKITKLYVDYCIKRDIAIVYYGDLDSCTRDTTERNIGSHLGQKLNQWNYGQIMLHMENKLTRYGVKLIKVKEYYTSKKCPHCNKLNKPKGREYICKCGYKQHRDINGAINILNDNTEFHIERFNSFEYKRIA